jgi:dolichyl-phosphate-mannose--protein O-mannosyl transferase
MLGKQAIALGMVLFGDTPLGWRIMPALFGIVAVFAAMRALWFASGSRAASLFGGIMIAIGFPLLVLARIAMLDIFYAAFLLIGYWQVAAAFTVSRRPRWRMALGGVALGCAMASKWSALALAALPGLSFLALRIRAFASAGTADVPIGRMTLIEGAVWLGLLPLAVYFLSFWPAFFYYEGGFAPLEVFAFQREMLDLQQQVITPHTYQSTWPQWVGNWRAIWYLYEVVDGAQRGVLLIGNPLTSLAGLIALAWCGWAAVVRRRGDALAVLAFYAVALGFWILAAKPVQFYYHYMMAHIALSAALGLALADLWENGRRWWAAGFTLAACALFAWFYPILTAAPLDDPMDFLWWSWIDGWK